MKVRLLGSLELAEDGLPVAVGGVRQRAVLALLVLHANQVVPAERLLVELWGEDAPPTAVNALQAAVSRLRRALPQGRLITRPVGYLFRAAPHEDDVERFEQLLASGREALARGAAADAAGMLRRALSLWRGPALSDFRFDPFAQAEIARLEELRLDCIEERMEADLALGTAGELVGEPQRLTAEQPPRERLRGQLMLAMYRSDRQTDALAVYRDLRNLFAEELGLEPAPALRELEAAILRQDPAVGTPLAPSASAPAPVRKPVTVLCVELRVAADAAAGLDTEALDIVLGDALAALGSTLERHGGKLAAVAGERILGVFGVLTLHEDDALRAAQAALAGRSALAAALRQNGGLTLTMRAGVATGDALVGGPGPPGFSSDAIGRAVELAASAPAGEILVSQATLQLAAGALEVEHAGPGRLRLRSAQVGARPRAVRLDAPLVGRDATAEPAGRGLYARPRGTCSRAGDRARRGGDRQDPAGARARRPPGRGGDRARRQLSVLRRGHHLRAAAQTRRPDRSGRVHTRGAGGAAGRPGGCGARGRAPLGRPQPQGTGRLLSCGATRRLLETLARWEPLLVILDDLHWAEPTFSTSSRPCRPRQKTRPCCCSAWPARSCWSSVRPGRPAHGGPSPSSWSPLAADDAAILLDAPAEVPPPAWGRKQLLEAAARQALALYERKEDRVSVARARPLLAAGTPTTRPLPVNGGA